MQLYDTASAAKRPFAPLDGETARIYACGPTVYDLPHIGNARPAVIFGLLADILQLRWPVKYVRNVTDIDDKIIAAAAERKTSTSALTASMRKRYNEDMTAIGARKPEIEPLATAHIAQMQTLITTLLEKEIAYAEKGGNIAFAVNRYKDYGSLSKRNEEAMRAGARVEVAAWKRNPKDFVLWKPSKVGEPGWMAATEWAKWGVKGRGRPGWHIECSAMCHHFLGKVVDIHCGGADLIFPHHENEQAQSCSCFGTDKLAEFWVHNGHITVDGRKMSKSLGNVLTVRGLLSEHKAEAIRYFLLATHYHRPADWNEDSIYGAKAALDGWYRILGENAPEPSAPEPNREFIAALEDDINSPQALSVLHSLAATAKNNRKAKEEMLASAQFLGLLKQRPDQWFKEARSGNRKSPGEEEINAAIVERLAARQKGDYKTADAIRSRLLCQGIVLEDTPEGSNWRREK